MRQGIGAVWIPVLILAAFVVLVFLGMWQGWRKRARKHDLPPLQQVPGAGETPTREASAHYVGTTVAGDWLDRVVARGLGTAGACRIALFTEGLDVHRRSGSFRIPATSLVGARPARGLAGKVVPPHGLLVVSWRHGGYVLDTGFRLTDQPEGTARAHEAWISSVTAIAKENAA